MIYDLDRLFDVWCHGLWNVSLEFLLRLLHRQTVGTLIAMACHYGMQYCSAMFVICEMTVTSVKLISWLVLLLVQLLLELTFL